jgi:hypothetical protein
MDCFLVVMQCERTRLPDHSAAEQLAMRIKLLRVMVK